MFKYKLEVLNLTDVNTEFRYKTNKQDYKVNRSGDCMYFRRPLPHLLQIMRSRVLKIRQ